MDKSNSNLIKIRYLTKLLFITDMSRRGWSEVTLLRLYNLLYRNRKKSDVYEYLWTKAIPIWLKLDISLSLFCWYVAPWEIWGNSITNNMWVTICIIQWKWRSRDNEYLTKLYTKKKVKHPHFFFKWQMIRQLSRDYWENNLKNAMVTC